MAPRAAPAAPCRARRRSSCRGSAACDPAGRELGRHPRQRGGVRPRPGQQQGGRGQRRLVADHDHRPDRVGQRPQQLEQVVDGARVQSSGQQYRRGRVEDGGDDLPGVPCPMASEQSTRSGRGPSGTNQSPAAWALRRPLPASGRSWSGTPAGRRTWRAAAGPPGGSTCASWIVPDTAGLVPRPPMAWKPPSTCTISAGGRREPRRQQRHAGPGGRARGR